MHHRFQPLPEFCLDGLFLAKSSSIHLFLMHIKSDKIGINLKIFEKTDTIKV